MNTERPDPDALLAKVTRDEARTRRGSLKILFGAAAGVGKTYAMLQAAQQRREDGDDVVIGYVETHGRAETEELVQGLEILAPRAIEYRGATLREFDIDAALKRRPALILVDELAHTNAQGSRHPKRWQDIEELLAAGIDVYTTLNVQHLESLNDVVGQITGVRVWETVPDTVFESADEVELVDLPPDELLERLREGKVYVPQQAQHAIENFFRKGNLIALRELSLRRTAERVDAQMRDYRDDHAIRDVWQATDRVLVCVGPGPLAARLVRAGRRLATALRAEWIVAYVETPQLQRLAPGERDEILRTLRLAEELGAETATLSGADMSSEILGFAHRRNVTKIVMGKPSRGGWRRWLLGSVVDTVVREASDLDIHLFGSAQLQPISDEPQSFYLNRSRSYLGLDTEHNRVKARWPGYLWSVAATLGATAIAMAMHGRFELSNVVMVYLLAVVIVASKLGRGPSILTVVLGVAAFDFFFVPPYLSFAVSDTEYLVTFAVMLVVGIVISSLTVIARSQAKIAGYRERRAASLYAMSKELAASRSEDEILAAAVRHLGAEFESQNVILFPGHDGKLVYPRAPGLKYSLHGADLSVAQWVYDHHQMAGRGTDTLPGSDAIYFPLAGASGTIGVLAILPVNLRRVFLPEQQRLLETFMTQIAQAIERVRLADDARAVQLRAETESMRNSLLSAISHDLRTPLASIVGASSSLIEGGARLDDKARLELGRTIFDEARRMTALANNILDMARLDAGSVRLNAQWVPIEEIIGSVLTRLDHRLAGRTVKTAIGPELPLLKLDAVMIEQVLLNLLENSLKYTPAGSALEIGARREKSEVWVYVADRGPGIAPGTEQRLFEKFFRGESEPAQSGVGLGLAICSAIIAAHGGRIWAENRTDGGALFSFALPVRETPPSIERETEAARSA